MITKRLLILLFVAASAIAGPVYNTQNPPPMLGPGGAATLWTAETPTPGTGTTAASQQVILLTNPGKSGTPFSIDGKFSAAPGAFEIDVQVSAVDADANYQTCSNCNVTTVDATNFTFHLDAVLVNARFMRLLMRTRTNAVSITATATGG